MEIPELITRNIEEILTEAELIELLRSKKKIRTYVGYETSGFVHIGTAATALKQLDFIKVGWEVVVLLADLHTFLNSKGSKEWIERMVDYWREIFKALGLKKAEYVTGSEFEYDRKYVLDLLRSMLLTTQTRARRSMDVISKEMEDPKVSQLVYPLMQSLDIGALNLDVAHGGMEQRKIHVLAREILPKLGFLKPVCVHGSLLSSIKGPGEKMSSSKPETVILVHEKPEDIRKKMQNAYCVKGQEEDNFPLDVAKMIVFPVLGELTVIRPEKFGGDLRYTHIEDLVADFVQEKLHPLDLKNAVAEATIKVFTEVRDMIDSNRDLLGPLKERYGAELVKEMSI
ncbi:MAG: tyrosine--tRNA ligase [Candidatus Lokiarchaeota archaeon]|nr:tyrosine--tRNA ligase [Candidatus Lokiarchaeota archaeon]